MPASETVKRIRDLLRRLRKSASQQRRRVRSGDELEEIWDRIAGEARALPRPGILEAFDQAVGRSTVSASDLGLLLSQWMDEPTVRGRIGELLEAPEGDLRIFAIEMVGTNRLVQYAENLNPIMESDASARRAAISAAGALRSPVNLPV